MAQQNKETQQHYDELEQCGRRLCLRIDSVPKQNNEKAEDVFKFVKELIEVVPDPEIPEVVINRAHRIGPDYINKKNAESVSVYHCLIYNVLSSYSILQISKVYRKQSTG